ncbi:extracellular calcium-sensing receptor-like [Pleurodeles waltl]|uniref:extracellular calcium-sensing receptor-like n=1 Tax=Pleurodeles waltl TaxID=8319 RepID=UPI003709A01B
MVFAIDDINREQTILPNISLGFLIYDTCLWTRKAIESSMRMLTGEQRPILNYQCRSQSPLTAVIGEESSTVSMAVARLLGIYRYPQVSYYSTSPLLNNKHEFPSFFRTIPSDDSQAIGMAKLVEHFGWTWVGILSNEDDYGSFHLLPVMRALSIQNITGKVWIASDGWSTASNFPNNEFANIMTDTIGFTVHGGAIPGFEEFLLKLHPSNYPKDTFVRSFWEQAMGCKWSTPGSNQTLKSGQFTEDTPACTGDEKLLKFKNKHQNEPDIRIFSVVYNAVYAVAYALKNMLSCAPGHGPFTFKTCAKLKDFKPWQLLHYMKTVRFKNKMGEEIYFDRHGSPPAAYDIINWHREAGNVIRYAKVGTFDTRTPRGQELYVNESASTWIKQGRETPRSICSESCMPGFHKAGLRGQPACCYDCIPCSEGEMSEKRDSSKCWPCPSDQWPNERRNDCIQKKFDVLSYTDSLGLTLTTTAIICIFVSIFFLCIFIKFQDTPIVKANNRNLTYLLLGSIVLSLSCSLLFIGEPQPITCLLRQTAFGVVFAFCISCVLAKTIMVVIAFKATKPGSNMRRWLGPQAAVIIVCCCTFFQVLICLSWLLICPPFPEKNMKLKTGAIIVKCNECSGTAFWCMLGYMGLLACVSFLVAFLARKLPNSFNEAKWITFSMLVFLSVWLAFIPGYLSTQGKFVVAVETFAIISSSTGILVCIFLPKCYIILMRPELNTKQYLLGNGSSNSRKIKNI